MAYNIGYNSVSYSGAKIHFYVSNPNQVLGVISASTNNSDINKTLSLSQFDDDRYHYAKINAGYFNMSTGEHYGTEHAPTRSAFTYSGQYQVVYMDMDGWIQRGLDNEVWLDGSWDQWALSPYGILYHNGQEVNEISSAYAGTKGSINSQSFIIQLTNKKYIVGVVEGSSGASGLTPAGVRNWAKSQFGSELYHLSLYDSGGSTQMRCFTSSSASSPVSVYAASSRKLVNVFTIFDGITSHPQDVTVNPGDTASFGINIGVSGWSFQWQKSLDGNTWVDITDAKAKTLEVLSTNEESGTQFRCKVNGYNHLLYSNPATLTLEEVKEPEEEEPVNPNPGEGEDPNPGEGGGENQNPGTGEDNPGQEENPPKPPVIPVGTKKYLDYEGLAHLVELLKTYVEENCADKDDISSITKEDIDDMLVSYKNKQIVYTSDAIGAEDNTGSDLTYIKSITQNENGEISVTKSKILVYDGDENI